MAKRTTWGTHGHFNMDTARERFMRKVDKRGPDDCWNWTGAIGSHKRYGVLGINSRGWLAHRAAWLLFKGDDPGEMCVCHHCDNGFCVNPKHLFLGTQTDNIHDMEAKRRSYHPSGENHGRALLTWNDVDRIRKQRERGDAVLTIAKRFGVGKHVIDNIIYGRTWITRRSR